MWHSRPPPPFMAKTILNFHFDYWNPSLRRIAEEGKCNTIGKNCVLNSSANLPLPKYSDNCHCSLFLVLIFVSGKN